MRRKPAWWGMSRRWMICRNARSSTLFGRRVLSTGPDTGAISGPRYCAHRAVRATVDFRSFLTTRGGADDLAFVRQMMPTVRGIVDAYLGFVSNDGCCAINVGWNFVDWAAGWSMGMPPDADGERAACCSGSSSGPCRWWRDWKRRWMSRKLANRATSPGQGAEHAGDGSVLG